MLKLSANALGMLIAKYRSVYKKCFLKNAVALAAAGLICAAPAPAAATVDYYDAVGGGTTTYTDLEDLRINVSSFNTGDKIIMSSNDSSLTAALDFGGADVTIDFQGLAVTISPAATGDHFLELGGGETVTLVNAANATISGFNTVSPNSSNIHGGAMSSTGSEINVADATFTGNSIFDVSTSVNSNARGGAIFAGGGSMINAYGATFTGNYASVSSTASDVSGYGGAICASGSTIDADGATFMDNYVSIATTTTTTNSSGAGLYGYGGAISATSSTISVDGATFMDNYVTGSSTNVSGSYVYGGAIYATGSTLSADGATFIGNYVSSPDQAHVYGGAIYVSNSTIDADGAIFTDNYAVSAVGAARGGAIYAERGTINAEGATFADNYVSSGSSSTYGGAICATGNTTINAKNASFQNNTAIYGGAIIADSSTINVEGAIFTGNSASGSSSSCGGAISASGSTTINAKNASFQNNTVRNSAAAYGGGAIYATGSTTINLGADTGQTSTFSGNTTNGVANSIFFTTSSASEYTSNLTVDGDGTLDMLDPINSVAGTYNIDITKTGAGTWKLGGTNSFNANGTTGTTFAVNEGTLDLYQNATITIGKGSFTLGEGTSAATLISRVGNDITAPDITIANNTVLGFDLTSATTSTTNLTFNGTFDSSSQTIGSGEIRLYNSGSPLAYGTYTLVDASGSTGATFANSGTLYYNDSLAFSNPGGRSAYQFYLLSTASTLAVDVVDTSVNTSLTWTGANAGGSTDIWDVNDKNNWTGIISGYTVTKFLDNDDVLFNDTGATQNITVQATSPATAVTVGDMTVNNSIYDYTFSGNGITGDNLVKNGSGTLTLNNASSFTTAININDGRVNMGNSDALTGGNITMSAGTTLGFKGSYTVNNNVILSGTGDVTFDTEANSDSLTGDISGTGVLEKTGTGTLTLGGANTYTGGTNITAGRVNVDSNSAVGNGNVTMSNGTTLGFTGNYNINNNITLNGTATIDTDTNSNTISGVIDGASGILTKAGAGTLTLSGANTYTGGTNITAGRVNVGNANALSSGDVTMSAGTTLGFTNNYNISNNITLNGTATIDTGTNSNTVSGVIDGVGGILTKAGTGTLTLSGVNTYSGGTNITAGTLVSQDAGALGAGLVTNNSTAALILEFNGTFANALQGAGDLTTKGNITINNDNSGFTGDTTIDSATLTLGNANAIGAGDVTMENNTALALAGNYVLTNDITLNGTAKIDTDTNSNTLSGVIDGASGILTKAGAGTLTLSGANTYTGGTNITDGRVNVDNASALSSGNVTMSNGTTLGFTNNYNINNNITLTGTTATIDTDTHSNTVSGVIDGAGTLTKAGAGTLTLSGANTYTGGTDITAGRVNVDNASALSSGDVTMSDGTTLGFTGNYNLSNNITVNGTTATIDTGTNSNTVSGMIDGAGTLTKAGTGTLTLDNANTYTGGTNITAGTLVSQDAGALGNGLVTNDSNAALILEFNGTFANALQGAGSLTTKGNITINNNNSGFTGDTTIDSATLTLGDANAIGTGDVTMENNTTLALAGDYVLANDITLNGTTATIDTGTNSDTLSGVIDGAGTLTKVGAGTLTLSGSNTYSGGTALTAGRVNIGNAGALSSGNVTMSGGTTLGFTGSYTVGNDIILTGDVTIDSDTAAYSDELTGDISGAGGLDKTGDGTLTISGTNVYTGSTTVTGGTLTGNIASGTALTVNSGATYDTGSGALAADRIVSSLNGSGTVDMNGQDLTVGQGDFSGGTLTDVNKLTKNTANSFTVGTATVDSVAVDAGTLVVHAGDTLNVTNLIEVADNATLAVTADVNQVAVAAGSVDFGSLSNLNVSGYTGSQLGDTVTLITSTTAITNMTGHYTVGGGTTPDYLTAQVRLSSDAKAVEADIALSWYDNHQDGSGQYDYAHGTFTVDGDFTLGTILADRSGTFTTNSWDGQTLTKAGAGILTLSGVNTYSGGTVITAGTLVAQNVDALGTGLVTNNAALTLEFDGTFANVLQGTGDLTTKGNIAINNNNSGFSGSTTIASDTLTLGNANAIGASAVTMADNTTLALVGSYTLTNAITLDGAATIDTAANDDTLSGVVDGAGSLTKNGSGALTLSGANTYTGGTAITDGMLTIGNNDAVGSGEVTMSAGTTLGFAGDYTVSNNIIATGSATFDNAATYNDELTGVISGASDLNKTGAGTLTLSGSNTYSGDTTVTGGTLTGNITAGTVLTVAGGATYDTGSGALAADRTVSALYGGGTVNMNSQALTVSEGAFSGMITGSGSALVKDTAGTLELSGSNTYTGGTAITAGTLNIGDNDALGSGDVTMSAGTTLGFIGNYTVGNDIILTGNVIFDTSIYSDELSGNINGTSVRRADSGFTKTGTGTLTLSGTNTYTGDTVVAEGTLIGNIATNTALTVDSGATYNTGSGALAADRTVSALYGAGTVEMEGQDLTVGAGGFRGTITGSGSALIKNTTGTLTLSGSNTYSGGTNITDGTLIIGNNNAAGSGDVTMSAGTTLGFDGDYTVSNDVILNGDATIDTATSSDELSGAISGAGGFAKIGAGTLTLSGTNTYLGSTTVSEGTLTGNIANNTALTVDSGATYNTGSGALAADRTVSALNGAGTVEMNGQSLTVGQGNFSGGTLINVDKLTKNTANTFTVGTATVNSAAVDDGTLVIAAGNTLTVNGLIEVADYATLSVTADKNQVAVAAGSASFDSLSTIDVAGYSGSQVGDIVTLITSDTAITNMTNQYTIGGGTSADYLTAQVYLSADQKAVLADVALTWYDSHQDSLGQYDYAHGTFTVSGGFEVGTVLADRSGTFTTNSWDGKTLTKEGTGTLTLTASNTYSGGTNLTQGRIDIGDDDALGTGALTMANDTTLGFAGDHSVGNDITVSGSATVNSESYSGTLSGVIDGAGSLTKDGSGTLTLTNANTYSGGTVIADGRLVSQNADALGSGLVQNDAALTLDFNGTFANALQGAGDLTTSGNVTINNANSGFTGDTTITANTLTLGDADAIGSGLIQNDAALSLDFNGTFANELQGAGSLTTNGNITINRDNSNFSGDTTIAANTLTLGDANAVGGGLITNDGTLSLDFDGTFANELQGAGSLTTNGTLTISSDNSSFTGDTTVAANTLTLTAANALGSGQVTNNAALNLDFDGTFVNDIQGTGELIKSGSGEVILSGNNSYSGDTVIEDGTLTINNVNSLSASSAIANNGVLNLFASSTSSTTYNISSYSGTGTVGIQASVTASGQWSDLLSFSSTPQSSVNVYFYFTDGSNATYLSEDGVQFAHLATNNGTDSTFALSGTSSLAGATELGIKTSDYQDYYLVGTFNPSLAKVYTEASAASLAQAAWMHNRELFKVTEQASRQADGHVPGIAVGFSRNDFRQETGSHADIDGNSLAMALAFKADDKTTWGIYGQKFEGSYRTSHSVALSSGGYTVHSAGDLKTHDIGLFAEHRPSGEAASGYYYQAFVSAGRSTNDFSADNTSSGVSTFRSGRDLFSASLGGGYVKDSGKGESTDYYSHLIYTRLGSDSVTDSIGQNINLQSSESVRLLSGVKFNFNQNRKTKTYFGVALDYEFSGKTNAYVNGLKADGANIKGLTGILELGLTANQNDTWTIDLGLQGYMGKKEGLGGMVTVSTKF